MLYKYRPPGVIARSTTKRQRVCPTSISAKRSRVPKRNSFRRRQLSRRLPLRSITSQASLPTAFGSVDRPGRIFSLSPSHPSAVLSAGFTFLMEPTFCGPPPPGRTSFFIRGRFRLSSRLIRSTLANSRIRSISLLAMTPDRPRPRKRKLLLETMSGRRIFLSRPQRLARPIRR